MTIKSTMKGKTTPPSSFGKVYRDAFVAQIHYLLHLGHSSFSSTQLQELALKEETAISGLIVEEMRKIAELGAHSWASSLAIHDDKPLSVQGLEGKNRPRIDIELEQTLSRPRARFQFEAKRLYRRDSVAEYVGPKGLGMFLSGKYAPESQDVGMLGYVINKTPEHWIGKIENKLKKETEKHHIKNKNIPLDRVVIYAELKHSYLSIHNRKEDELNIYHTLLKCF